MEKEPVPFTYSEITRNVRVSVRPQYLDDHSDPDRGVFVFAYSVTVENFGLETVQLLRRHWVVNSGGGLYTEVKGDGVVGEQPVLACGDSFTYTSTSMIKDPVGSMYGTYMFQSEDGQDFEVTIPEFDLVFPGSIH
ncbi:MAG: Co2+/Mg2+ efflux protein ApaG [Deltaproteobacteria bacterium]|nr:Co2+/Mg2+ efflux protein ApaG [Deltaproteobacteria bacterium]